MNVDKDIEGFIKTIKEEPDKCDESFEEMQINLGDFLEPKQELNEEINENNPIWDIVDPLQHIQVKREFELCSEDNAPLKDCHVKIEPELCLEDNDAISKTTLQRKFLFNLIYIC